MELDTTIQKFYFLKNIEELSMMHTADSLKKLTYNSKLYLDIINFVPNCTVTTLSNILGVAKSSVTIKINELVDAGYIIKIPSNSDKRVLHLYLTEKPVFNEIANIGVKVNKEIAEEFSQESVNNFCLMLEVMIRKYGKYSKILGND
ncbi:MAG: MarR family transcriptional regulator [Clostridia bacterium]